MFATTGDLIQNLKNRYLNLTTFEANFTQINYFSQHGITHESKGTFYLQNDTIILEYTAPDYQFLKSHNSLLTMYFQNENTAIIDTSENPITHTLLHFSNLLSQDFEFYRKENNLYVYTILNPMELAHDLKIHINNQTNTIDIISYSDEFNNIITIRLDNQRFNRPLTKTVGEFVIPDGTYIIQN